MDPERLPHLKDPARLAALRAVALLDTPAEEAFDRLARLAVTCLNVPIALVTLIDADRLFLKSCIGLPEPWASRREIPLTHSFCVYNRIAGQPLLIEDARKHPLVKDNPAIRDIGAIAYLGFPLVTPDGYILGTFCVLDAKPRRWQAREIAIVRDLTDGVMTEIQLRTEMRARSHAEAQRDSTTELNELLRMEVYARKQAEEQLQTLNNELERRVEERTRELQETQSHCMHVEKLSAIGKLSASIAHEFNNPLQSVMTILHGFKNRIVFEEEDKGLLELAITESHRMKNLIRGLQDFYRSSSGEKTFMDVHACINAVLLLCQTDFKRKRISTVLHFHKRLPLIMGIPDQLKQVFMNLLDNAADALQPDGVITISTCHDEQRVVVEIKDTGIGIRPADMGRIFQPFYTTKPAVKGTGLGLSICHGIVQSHRGEIRVESEPGKGSAFTILLPVDEPSHK